MFLIFTFNTTTENLHAEIYFKNELLENIDLTKEKEERHIDVEGLHGHLTVAVKENAVAIIHSNCPEQLCVKQGWVTQSNRSIICAYNAVYVTTTGGAPDFDIEV